MKEQLVAPNLGCTAEEAVAMAQSRGLVKEVQGGFVVWKVRSALRAQGENGHLFISVAFFFAFLQAVPDHADSDWLIVCLEVRQHGSRY